MISFRDNANGTRVADAKCAMCGGKFDAITQIKSADGIWSPDIERVFSLSGWLRRNDLEFCGRFCADRHSYATEGRTLQGAPRQPVAVTKPIIPSPKRPVVSATKAAR